LNCLASLLTDINKEQDTKQEFKDEYYSFQEGAKRFDEAMNDILDRDICASLTFIN